MSWIDKIQDGLTITTADNKQYKPNWLRPQKETNWNSSSFDFIEREGTLVRKKKRQGRKIIIDLFFQGDDHLQIADDFDKSCNDERPILFQHPYYGTLTVQIISILQDNTQYNISRLGCTILETIEEINPIVSIDAVNQIPKLKEIADVDLELVLTQPISATDANVIKTSTKDVYAKGVPVITLPEEFEEYSNLFSTADTYINTITATPLLAIRALIAMINKPALFSISTENRLNLLIDQFNILRNTIGFLTSVGAKQMYQIQGNALISAMCNAAITPLPGNYTNNTSVFKIIDKIIARYGEYINDLDELQGKNGGNPLNFIPDSSTINQLDNIFNMTLSNLNQIALNARKERFIFLAEDTNLFELTSRLYSLDPEDKNMEELIENNNMGPDDILQLRKGRKIVYYI